MDLEIDLQDANPRRRQRVALVTHLDPETRGRVKSIAAAAGVSAAEIARSAVEAYIRAWEREKTAA